LWETYLLSHSRLAPLGRLTSEDVLAMLNLRDFAVSILAEIAEGLTAHTKE
jgi:hypothetical protein